MSEYTEEINDMRWSYSRISTFARCKYSFYKKYIEEAFEKVNYYLKDSKRIADIAENGYKKVNEIFTFRNTITNMLNTVQNMVGVNE